MDEIIYLEPDEEITSVIDKIKQAKSKRISLVVPREAMLLQSVVNLRLLIKEASNLNKEIALVTADKIGRNLAARVGLTVYDSIRSDKPEYLPPAPAPTREEIIEINDAAGAPEKDIKPKGVEVHHFQETKKIWKNQKVGLPTKEVFRGKVHREVDWSKTRKLIWPLFVVILLLILIGAFLILPKVNVRLKVKAENFEKNLTCQITGDETTKIESSIFGGKLIDLTQEKEEKFPTTGQKNLGGKATGTLTLYNYWDSSVQELGAGTKFSSSSKTFISKSDVSVPGTSIRGGNIVPGTATVDIEAENPGEEYNVKAGRFTIIGLSADQQEKIYGQSSKDLTGGFSKVVQVVSEQDINQAKEKLINELNEKLHKELQDEAGDREILEDALQIETAEEVTSHNVDAEAQEFSLKIKQRLRQIAYLRSDFKEFILTILEKQIPYDKMITLGSDDVISPKITEKNYDQNILNLDIAVTAKISSRIDTQKVKDNLLGESQTESKSYLEGLEGISGFEIEYFPAWWPIKRIPNFQTNVVVSLDYLEPEAVTSPTPTPTISPEISPEASE